MNQIAMDATPENHYLVDYGFYTGEYNAFECGSLVQPQPSWPQTEYSSPLPVDVYAAAKLENMMGFEVVAGYTEPVAHGSTSSPPTDHFDPHGTGWISEPPVVPTQEPHGCFPLSPEVPDPTKSPSDNYSQMLNSIQDQILSAEGIDRPSQSTLAFSDYDFASQPYSLYANSYPEAIETPMPNFYLPPSPLAGAFNPSSSSLANALIPLDAQEKSTPISHTNRVSQKAGSIRSPANGKGRQPSTSKLAKSSRSSGSSQRYDASEITQPSHNQAKTMTPAPKKRRIGLKRDATQAAAHIGGESHGSYSSEQAKYQNGHIQNDQVPQVIDLQQAAAPARDASKIVRQPRRETACISTETVAHAPGKVSAGDHSRAPRKDMLAGAVSGGSAAPMEVGPPVAERKPKLACLFCRGRKIACGPPETEADGKTCNQCSRRSLVCEFPSHCRRGVRKKINLVLPRGHVKIRAKTRRSPKRSRSPPARSAEGYPPEHMQI